MSPHTPVTATAALLIVSLAAAMSAQSHPKTAPAADHHVMVQADTLAWKPLRPGAEMAVVAGDPAKPGPFVIRFRYHGPVTVPPHWHPNDEHLTVITGTFALGMGEQADAKAVTNLTAGGYALAPAKMPHYAWAKGETTILQVHGMGPFSINYVNPADDPSRNKKF